MTMFISRGRVAGRSTSVAHLLFPSLLADWKGAFCGNKIVEDGEECDCGYDDDECEEKCCYPRVVSEKDRELNPAAQGCKRRPRKKWSLSERVEDVLITGVSSVRGDFSFPQGHNAAPAKASAATALAILCQPRHTNSARKTENVTARPFVMDSRPSVLRRPIIRTEPNVTATLRCVRMASALDRSAPNSA